MKRTLMYLLYGNRIEYRYEFLLSCLTARRHLVDGDDDIEICLVTDATDFDPELPIDILSVPTEQINEWANGYNHRVKLMSLLHVLDKKGGAVVFIDTDTIFEGSPAVLFDRVSEESTVMHTLEIERIVDDPLWPPVLEQLSEDGMAGLQINTDNRMFNSGIIGVLPKHRAAIERSVELTDSLAAIDPTVMNLEQFAIARALDEVSDVRTSEDIIRHYWDVSRPFIHLATERMFDGDFSASRFEELVRDPSLPALGWPAVPAWVKAVARARAVIGRWDPDYAFAYHCYLASLAWSTEDSRIASLLAARAGQILTASAPSAAERDFRRFGPRRLDRQTWLTQDVADTWRALWSSR